MKPVTEAEFRKRLPILCRQNAGFFPRKPRDQHILFKSLCLTLEPGRPYSETDLNLALETWLQTIGTAVEIDHVTLRRYLVDAGYIERDAAGSSYHLVSGDPDVAFEAAIAALDQPALLAEAEARREAAKRKYAG